MQQHSLFLGRAGVIPGSSIQNAPTETAPHPRLEFVWKRGDNKQCNGEISQMIGEASSWGMVKATVIPDGKSRYSVPYLTNQSAYEAVNDRHMI